MSDGDVIVISSDEDPDLVKVSEEKECINNITAAQTSVEKLQNNGANEIPSIDLTESSVNTTLKEKGKEKCINQSDNFQCTATESKISSESFDTIENNFCGNESETFKKFMSVVLPAEPDENDRARIVKKLNKYYKLAHPSYIRSPEFNKLLEKGIEKITENSVFLYFVLKDVRDCLLSNKVEFKSLKNTEDKMLSSGANAPEKPHPGSSLESDNLTDANKEDRKQKIVKKLTSLLKKVNVKIKQLEELEVDFSDEEDSNYFKMQKYRERFCQVYEKLCSYTTQPLNGHRVGGFRKINFSYTENLELNRAIEKWLNKTKQFPDYYDVNKFLIELNQSLNLKLTKEQVKIKAQQIFEKIGNMLQRRRHFDLWDSLSSFLNTEVDPAVKNPDLESVLRKNYDLGIKKEKELLRYYAERQEKEELQPLEVPDEEANCSPVESGDEDEEEIEIMENMLDSKISTDDDGVYNENEENDQDPSCLPDSGTRNKGSSKMDVEPGTRVENNDSGRISVSNENSEQIDDVGSKGIDSRVRVNSEQTETVGTNIRTIPVKDENEVGAVPNKQDSEDNLVVSKSENLMKRKNENLNENDNDDVNVRPCKRFLEEKEMKETKKIEETEIIKKSDSDSDCEIVEIVSSKEGENNEAVPFKRKMYQINYAFINNTFNYNTILSSNIFRKKHCFSSNYKNMKNQKPFYDFPPDEFKNIKSITNKYALYGDNKLKWKLKSIIFKPKCLNSIIYQTSKDFDLKNNDLSTGNNSINCPLHQEKSSENMKSQREENKTNQNNDLQEGSNNETAAPPNGGSSSGGNGQDNGENNGNKKPFDRETQTEDNPENEDKEEDEEEDADIPEENPREAPKAIATAPKIMFTRTYERKRKVPGGAVLKLPPTETAIPVRRNSSGKQSAKPPGSEIAQRKEPLNSPPAARTPRARQPAARKRKINQNGGIQATPQQEKISTFTFHFKKGTAELKKPTVNKPIPTASTSKDDDVEIIQVTKKKRSTPVKSVQSDEEIVKNFLERSHPSISITTPKKKAVQKEPPPSVRQALETLSRLKGISTTIVKVSSKQNTDDEVTIIGESLNTRVNKISKQQKIPVPSATATTSSEPLLPKIVTVQGNAPGFEDKVDHNTAMRENVHQNYVQNPQPALTISGAKSNYNEHFNVPQPRLANVSGNACNYNEHFNVTQPRLANVSGNACNYSEHFNVPQARLANVSGTPTNYNELLCGPQARLANVSGTPTNYNELLCGPQARLANVSGTPSNYNEHFYGPQAPAATMPGSASTYQENLFGPAAPAATMPGNASTCEENFTGTVECIPIPRFRNVKSRSKRTPKKTKDIEYVIID